MSLKVITKCPNVYNNYYFINFMESRYLNLTKLINVLYCYIYQHNS